MFVREGGGYDGFGLAGQHGGRAVVTWRAHASEWYSFVNQCVHVCYVDSGRSADQLSDGHVQAPRTVHWDRRRLFLRLQPDVVERPPLRERSVLSCHVWRRRVYSTYLISSYVTSFHLNFSAVCDRSQPRQTGSCAVKRLGSFEELRVNFASFVETLAFSYNLENILQLHRNLRSGLRPGPRWGSLRRSPDSIVSFMDALSPVIID